MYSGLQFLTLMVWIRINWFNNVVCSKLGKCCQSSSETEETILLVMNRTGGKQNFAQAAIKLTGVVTDLWVCQYRSGYRCCHPNLEVYKESYYCCWYSSYLPCEGTFTPHP